MSIGNAAFTRTNAFTDEKERCFPRFHEEAIQDELASRHAGHPVFKMQERVEIIMPGNALNRPVAIVTDEHRERWPREYEQFRKGLEMSHDGLPLEEWPILNKAMVKELKYRDIYTVEQVAALDDLAVQRIGMGGMELRKKARAFLDDAERSKLVETVTGQNDSMKAEIAALKRQVEELSTLLSATHANLVAKNNEPNPIAATAPYQMDPLARPVAAPEAPAESALSGLTKRGPGRPRKIE